MKIILVDAIHVFVIKGEGIFQEMFDMLEQYPNRKILLTNANNEEICSERENDNCQTGRFVARENSTLRVRGIQC